MSQASTLTSVILRSIDDLSNEIEANADDGSMWTVHGTVTNAVGTLCLHLVGNLHHFIGATLGHTGYVRDRPAEFATRDVPKHALLEMVADVRKTVASSLAPLTDADLDAPYPLTTFGEGRTLGFVLMTLAAHLSYHLGQMNYLRRMMEHPTHG